MCLSIIRERGSAMTQHPRSSVSGTRYAFILVVSSAAAIAGLQAAPLPDGSRLTSVANVTLRQTPAPGAPAVGQLPLGTELADAGPPGMDKTWIRVRAADGLEGWVLANMTKRIDPVWRWTTYDEIVADRLARKGDGFPAAVELVNFIDRVAPEYTNPDGRAHIELDRMRALSAALSAIPAKGDRREPYASWLRSQSALVIYDEPGKRWLLSDKAIWELQARSSKTPSADPIAWLAVTNGLNGECEGYLPCYVDWRNRLEGEYLRRHPDGAHASDAVTSISRTVGQLAAPARPHEAFQFDRGRDCRDLTASLEALTKAVQVTRTADKETALTSLGSLKRLCQ
jgi:hypothetical protein